MKNKTLWIIFTITYHLLSWVSVLVYAGVKYGAIVKENSVVIMFGFAGFMSVLLLMHSLKETANHGFGMFRKIARSIRSLVPLLIGFVVVLVLNKNIGNIYNIIIWVLGANIIAQPFGILGYWMGPAYAEDTSGTKILKKIG